MLIHCPIIVLGELKMPDVKLWNRDNSGYTTYYVSMSNERDNVRITVYDQDQKIEYFDIADDNAVCAIEDGLFKYNADSIAKYVHNMEWDLKDRRSNATRTVRAHFADKFCVELIPWNNGSAGNPVKITLEDALAKINGAKDLEVDSGDVYMSDGSVIVFSDRS
jgi:hypothetical protein